MIEQVLPHRPEKVWRVLTEPELIRGWLMETDFRPVVGHRFTLRAEPVAHWNGVTDCEVLVVEPYTKLSYTWSASSEEAARGIKTIVTFTLTPVAGGTHVRMEQSGFGPEDERNFQGATYGWRRFFAGLDRMTDWLQF